MHTINLAARIIQRIFGMLLTMIMIGSLFGCPNDTSDGSDKDANHSENEVEISWIDQGTLLVFQAEYDNGALQSFIGHNYFVVTSGSGSVEIMAELANNAGESVASCIEVFPVQEGATYRLSLEINCTGPSDYDPGNPPQGFPNELTVTYSSPCADTIDAKTLQGGFYTDSLSLGHLAIEPWTPSPQVWSLTVNIVPDGAGTISDNHGQLALDGDQYAADYPQGTTVILTATPAQGYVFDEWYGTYATLGTTIDNQITFSMFINGYMEARFVEN